MKKLFALLAIIVTLSACDDRTPEQKAADHARYCSPIEVSRTDDGVVLYRVSSRCDQVSGSHDVYFSTRGTQTGHTESCGKNCSRTVDDLVPNNDENP